MENETRDILLPLLRAFRLQQEQLLRIMARLRALQAVFAETTHSDPQVLSDSLLSFEDQVRNAEPAIQAQQKIDEIIHLLERGQRPQVLD
jgi:hypothetical protein